MLSWSLLNAMASGCVVLASDVPPVREVIEPGENGLVEPLFDVERLTETALQVRPDKPLRWPDPKTSKRHAEQEHRPGRSSGRGTEVALDGNFSRGLASRPTRGSQPEARAWPGTPSRGKENSEVNHEFVPVSPRPGGSDRGKERKSITGLSQCPSFPALRE